MMTLLQAGLVAGMTLVHLFAGGLRFLDVLPRSRWLSAAGGISVAYVFLHIFSELSRSQQRVQEIWPFAAPLESHIYLIALAGLVVFYALERKVKGAKAAANSPGRASTETPTGPGVFWLHVSSFGLYNAMIGYLLVNREEQDLRGLFFFAVAMALHFVVNDYGLRQDHRETYRRYGRWVLSAALCLGWALGLAVQVPGPALDVLFSFLAGGVILNVLKEELPEERRSRLMPFFAGAVLYSFLLLAV